MFLVIVPREAGLAPDRDLGTLFSDVDTQYREILGGLPRYRTTRYTPGTATGPEVLSIEKDINRDNYFEDSKYWVTAAGSPVAELVVENLHSYLSASPAKLDVHGAFAAVCGTRDTGSIEAWNTIPGIETIFYGEDENYFFLSNRPLLVGLGLARGDRSRIQLSSDFLVDYLEFGYPITDHGPFSNVNILRSNSVLKISGGVLKIEEPEDLPVQQTASLFSRLFRRSPSTDVQADHVDLVHALQEATSRIAGRVENRRVQLRVSGGKDSRLLIGLLRRSSMQVDAVVFGHNDDKEVAIARHASESAGLPFEVVIPPRQQGETLVAQVEQSLRLGDGLPLSEAHGSAYVGANPVSFGDGIMLGQWPLAKGGLARRLRYTPEEIQRAIYGNATGLVCGEKKQGLRRFLDTWIDNKSVTAPAEKLYYFSHDFRAARWMLALTTIYDRDATVVYPISDSEVTKVTNQLPLVDRVTQTAYFKALEKIWEQGTCFPFVGSKWRFEANGPNHDIGFSSYASRNGSISEIVDTQLQKLGGKGKRVKAVEYLTSTGVQMAREIADSPQYGELSGLLTSEAKDLILKWAQGNHVLWAGRSRRQTVLLIWRMFVADIWFRGDWLK